LIDLGVSLRVALYAHTAQALATVCPEPNEGPVSAAIANAALVDFDIAVS